MSLHFFIVADENHRVLATAIVDHRLSEPEVAWLMRKFAAEYDNGLEWQSLYFGVNGEWSHPAEAKDITSVVDVAAAGVQAFLDEFAVLNGPGWANAPCHQMELLVAAGAPDAKSDDEDRVDCTDYPALGRGTWVAERDTTEPPQQHAPRARQKPSGYG